MFADEAQVGPLGEGSAPAYRATLLGLANESFGGRAGVGAGAIRRAVVANPRRRPSAGAIRAAQGHLTCDGFLEPRFVDGRAGWRTQDALARDGRITLDPGDDGVYTARSEPLPVALLTAE